MTKVILPGDVVSLDAQYSSVQLKLGPGLIASDNELNSLTATKAGLLGFEIKETAKTGRAVSRWIETSGKRYTPAIGEPVVGVVVARHADGYRVDIGSAHMATLDGLAFEGATKRSKPNLKVGAIVYARVALAQPFAEPEIECVDQVTQKSQGFGELSGGMLVRSLPLHKCRALLSPSHALLPSFGARFPFECAIGLNGRAWIKSQDCEQTIEIVKALRG